MENVCVLFFPPPQNNPKCIPLIGVGDLQLPIANNCIICIYTRVSSLFWKKTEYLSNWIEVKASGIKVNYSCVYYAGGHYPRATCNNGLCSPDNGKKWSPKTRRWIQCQTVHGARPQEERTSRLRALQADCVRPMFPQRSLSRPNECKVFSRGLYLVMPCYACLNKPLEQWEANPGGKNCRGVFSGNWTRHQTSQTLVMGPKWAGTYGATPHGPARY